MPYDRSDRPEENPALTATTTLRMKRVLCYDSDERSHYRYVVQQLWQGKDEDGQWTEWHDLPVVDEEGRTVPYE